MGGGVRVRGGFEMVCVEWWTEEMAPPWFRAHAPTAFFGKWGESHFNSGLAWKLFLTPFQN
jgi:hypothetical protein